MKAGELAAHQQADWRNIAVTLKIRSKCVSAWL
jgi:hypothetical protein